MFSIPLFILLALYLIFLVIFFLFSFANVYHIYSTGTFTLPVFFITFLVGIWCLLILLATYYYTNSVDWQLHLTFFGPGGMVAIE